MGRDLVGSQRISIGSLVYLLDQTLDPFGKGLCRNVCCPVRLKRKEESVRPFLKEAVREMYSLKALTGPKQLSGSLAPTKLLIEAILIGEKAEDPSAAALVFGTKALAG